MTHAPEPDRTLSLEPPIEATVPAEAADDGPVPRRESPSRILIVEDNADAADMLRILLSFSGRQVDTATTGAQAVELARRRRPDVVLCDIGLPGEMDGFAVARAIRAEAASPSPYLVALTGYGREDVQRQCLDAGFDLQLTKPVEYAALEQVLSKVAIRR
jgi:CheY-like chemotaxis protein